MLYHRRNIHASRANGRYPKQLPRASSRFPGTHSISKHQRQVDLSLYRSQMHMRHMKAAQKFVKDYVEGVKWLLDQTKA